MEGLRYATIEDLTRGKVKILYAIPEMGNSWGALSPLKGTSWEPKIPIVSGETLSHAFHGYTVPFWKEVGKPPIIRARKLPLVQKVCFDAVQGFCALACDDCLPGSGKVPSCYRSPAINQGLREVASEVAKAWDEGRYVFVVEGTEFVVS